MPDSGKSRHLTLAYIADIHGQLEEHPELFWSSKGDEITTAGGAARIATAVRGLRQERPDQVLFMDAGDTIQGSAAAAWTEGAAVTPVMNALGVDLAIPGNWEVVYGPATMKKRAGELEYPTIAANIFDAATDRPIFAPYRIEERNGVRVAVIGYTDPDVPFRQSPSYSAGLRYKGHEVLPPLIEKVRQEEKADVVVLLTHIGLPKAVALADKVTGVDVILSSDTHERTYEPIVRGSTWIVEPGAFGSFLGRLDLEVRDGKVVDRRWELVELRADRFAEDPAVRQTVELALAPHRGRLKRSLAHLEVPLYRYNVVETALDALLADALREAAGTELALSNGFRFAHPIPAGTMTEGDLWNVFPVVTKLKTGTVTGRQLKQFWEKEIENTFSKNPERLFGGWLPRPSGMTVRFTADAPAGQRVREIRVGGQLLQEDRVYTIAACEREGDTEDALCRMKGVAEPKVLTLDAHQAVRDYLARRRTIGQPEGGRVIAEDLPAIFRSQFLTADGTDRTSPPVVPSPSPAAVASR